MIEQKIDELIGAIGALNDNIFELKQALAGTLTPPLETPTPAEPASPAPNTEAGDAETSIPSDSNESVGSASSAAVSKQDVMVALRALDKAKGKDAVQALLAKHKARNLTSLDESLYGAVIEEAQAA